MRLSMCACVVYYTAHFTHFCKPRKIYFLGIRDGAEVRLKMTQQKATVAAELTPPSLNGTVPAKKGCNKTEIDSNERLHVTKDSQRSSTRLLFVKLRFGKR